MIDDEKRLQLLSKEKTVHIRTIVLVVLVMGLLTAVLFVLFYPLFGLLMEALP